MPTHHVDVTDIPLELPTGPAAGGSALWVQVRPDLRRGAVIAGDILAALGKRRDVAGKGRNEHQDVTLAIAWMRAYDITALVITEAQRLHPTVLPKVISWANTAQIPLWLLHRAEHSDTFIRALARRGAHPRHLDEVPPPTPRTTAPGQRPTLGVKLPDAPFHQFRTACDTTLGKKAADRVRLRHTSTATRCYDTLRRDDSGPDVIARLAEGILGTAPEDDLLTVDIRALQLAAWHCDLYLKTDLPALLISPERQLTDPHTVDAALTAYRQPHRAVAVTLAMHQVGVRAIHQLPLTAANANGTVALGPGRQVEFPEHASRALRALVHLRTPLHEAKPTLLGIPERAVSSSLNDAVTDLGIRVHGRTAERHSHPVRWLRRLGLTLHPLT